MKSYITSMLIFKDNFFYEKLGKNYFNYLRDPTFHTIYKRYSLNLDKSGKIKGIISTRDLIREVNINHVRGD
ncbi:hypothetical protein [Sulfolobus acidocaldarius]|uniref:CBS domain-containing protein n=3 Tax=Sulfolobus acidocaldarius TaxID=2285 RepID=A0A0U3HBU4_9CREN|nr:hypothetical protein [Sulfolobus acidocaldarius]AGE70218.1 hypothetical protein SacN8_01185 [Sulfolobus acidocaldarius N8]ALU29374.1 hypothetical protein ATY89_05060 [Sulfolobus acidocaldarius]ALU32103.1 hypothetical protein ATZ20_08085 [Sulfolobus acidocaldarius]